MLQKNRVGRFGALVILAVSRLNLEDAIGVNIWHMIEGMENNRVATGSVYRTLKDLTSKGYLVAEEHIAVNSRRVHYHVTESGMVVLKEYHRSISVISRELDLALAPT